MYNVRRSIHMLDLESNCKINIVNFINFILNKTNEK